MIRAIVFDLWNTLVHSRQGDPFRHLRHLLTPEQAPQFPALKRDAMAVPHLNAMAFLERWRGPLALTEAQFAAMAEVFRTSASDAECFPEVLEALAQTRRLGRTALLSNTQGFDMEFMARLGLNDLLSNRFLSAETGFLKPEPQAYRAVQTKLGLFPGQLAMVGDSWNDDMEGALNAGWTAIWVNRTGALHPEVDPDADFLEVTDLRAVPMAIERLQAGARCSTCLG